jgi:hypothetical protein
VAGPAGFESAAADGPRPIEFDVIFQRIKKVFGREGRLV